MLKNDTEDQIYERILKRKEESICKCRVNTREKLKRDTEDRIYERILKEKKESICKCRVNTRESVKKRNRRLMKWKDPEKRKWCRQKAQEKVL